MITRPRPGQTYALLEEGLPPFRALIVTCEQAMCRDAACTMVHLVGIDPHPRYRFMGSKWSASVDLPE